METINERMQMIVDERFNGNKAAFAKAIGIAPTSISNYLGKQRASKPSVDMIVKIINTLDIDALWILTGRKSEQAVNKVEANGERSGASQTGDVYLDNSQSGDAAQIELLKKLLDEKDKQLTEKNLRIKDKDDTIAEKERTIQFLMGRK